MNPIGSPFFLSWTKTATSGPCRYPRASTITYYRKELSLNKWSRSILREAVLTCQRPLFIFAGNFVFLKTKVTNMWFHALLHPYPPPIKVPHEWLLGFALGFLRKNRLKPRPFDYFSLQPLACASHWFPLQREKAQNKLFLHCHQGGNSHYFQTFQRDSHSPGKSYFFFSVSMHFFHFYPKTILTLKKAQGDFKSTAGLVVSCVWAAVWGGRSISPPPWGHTLSAFAPSSERAQSVLMSLQSLWFPSVFRQY